MDNNRSISPEVLVLSGVRGDTRRYRTFHLHQQLQIAGIESRLSHTTDPRLRELAQTAAVVVLHRVIYDDYIGDLICAVHSRGGLVLVDTDDLVFDPSAFRWIDSPDFQDPLRAALYQEDMRRYRQTLEACDGVLASTDYLAQAAGVFGKPCWVHRNAANLELLFYSEQARLAPRPVDGAFVIGYASGTPTHNRDFGLIFPILQAFLLAHPTAQLRIIGYLNLDQSWEAFEGRVRHDPALPWRALPAWLAQLDLNLAPLVLDNPFSQSKSEIKYMEAALVGVPTLASPTDAFAAAIRPGQNGLLAEGPQDWQLQLERFSAAPLRQSLGQAALQDAHQAYTPRVRAGQAVALLNHASQELGRTFHWEAAVAQETDSKKFWWDNSLERHPTLLEMGLYTLHRRGARTLIEQSRVYFRRWLARYIPYKKAKQR